MSIKAILWAVNYSDVSASEKLVLLILANYADPHGISWPSQRTLKKKSGLAERSVRRILAQMESRGVIRRFERRRSNGSRTSDLILLEAFPDRSPVPQGLPGVNFETDADQPDALAEWGAGNRPKHPAAPATLPRGGRPESPEDPDMETPLDTSLIPNMTRQAMQGARESAAKLDDDFDASALAEAAREFAISRGVAKGEIRPPIDPLAPKPSKDNPLPAISGWPGWQLVRHGRYQDSGEIVIDPDTRAALMQTARALEEALAPALPADAARMIWALFCCYAPRRQGRAAELAVARQWLADLAEYPDDIIDAACTEWRRGQEPFAPRPGEWLALARPILEARRAWARRARSRADPGTAPEPARAVKALK